jgi:hypothetical protein
LPFLFAEGVLCIYAKIDPIILASFDTTPSPHGRINAPSWLLAFAHIHGEAGTPTEGPFRPNRTYDKLAGKTFLAGF